ncbi:MULTISPECIES: hypothetical protein [Hymenobacter]|uniref:Uncharacterized protein n=1 Tax=Hymenobacter jejuensis TaxID=2502781 RepID=A0A5B7ZX83_9BACT|nr:MULTISPECIES: hypothetical protein [Hymenobacter]MBC6988528.1 hypothetical protein [Hymenobacter sp. BT491]QDA59123.1 hypothetical protein FHG12_02945 [Hymenobacter jejuensis]
MASKILSFIVHVPGMVPGAYPAVPTAAPAKPVERKAESKSGNTSSTAGGHFAAIYENDRFVRFKYISNNA